MMKEAQLIFQDKHIYVSFDNEGHVDDITIFDEDNEILFSGNKRQSQFVMEAIEFALNYNYGGVNDDLNGLEDDRQEVE